MCILASIKREKNLKSNQDLLGCLGQGSYLRLLTIRTDFRDWLEVALGGTHLFITSPPAKEIPLVAHPIDQSISFSWDPGIWEAINTQAVHPKAFVWTGPFLGTWEHTGQVVGKGCTSAILVICLPSQLSHLSPGPIVPSFFQNSSAPAISYLWLAGFPLNL